MTVRELSGPPAAPELYARALLRGLPVIGAGGGKGAKLPDLELVVDGVVADREAVAAYDHVCGFTLGNALPATYIHVLTFPLQLRLMTDGSFPYSVLGLVHLRQRIEQTRPVALGEALTLRVRAEDLRGHDKGAQFDLVAAASVRDEEVWRGSSTYLARGAPAPNGGTPDADDGGPEEPTPDPFRAQARWKVPGDMGRRYAGVSGDRNPIHQYPLTAKLFGQPQPIAHGMWSMARCLAALEDTLPAAWRTDVRFRRPVRLPSTVVFGSWPQDGGRAFSLRDTRDRVHLSGVAVPA
jgi:acyl dehydratase